MALSQKEVQARYREKIKDGDLRRIELVIDKSTDHMIEYLAKALGATRKGTIVRAVQALYKEQRKFEEREEKAARIPSFGRYNEY